MAGKSALYNDYETSSMSLDQLTAAGKTVGKPRGGGGSNYDDHRHSSAPPAGLFFSPTAQQSSRAASMSMDNRGSSYLPAGYYASPSADLPAGGRASTTIGGSLAPYARNSVASPSPPGSPHIPESRSTSAYYGGAVPGSRDGAGLRHPGSREYLRAGSRDGGGRISSNVYAHPSSSSLAIGGSSNDLPGMRAPSQILDELFDNHGHGPRERF